MSKISRPKETALLADLLMVALCSIASFWLLASLLVAYQFTPDNARDIITFVAVDLVLSAVLSTIGVMLNHLAARNVRVTLRRRR